MTVTREPSATRDPNVAIARGEAADGRLPVTINVSPSIDHRYLTGGAEAPTNTRGTPPRTNF